MTGIIDRGNIVEYVVKLVNSSLEEFFRELHRDVLDNAPRAVDLVEIARDYTMRGGKRLRAVLALIGYWSREWGIGDVRAIADVMTAIELLQSYLLVHDDIMDRDILRRGGLTVHAWFTDLCIREKWSDCDHYGASQGIVTGDLLEASAISRLASTSIKTDSLRDLFKTYSRGLRRVAYGQYLDVMYSKLPLKNIREEDILLVYKLKTSSYTVELPLHLGAITSGKHSEKLLSELSRYAIPAGIAFQVRDDIIGLYGDPAVTGKPAGSDVKSKKKTILVIKAHELASDTDKQILELVYDKLPERDISDQLVEEVREIVKRSGSLDYAENVINRLVSEAEKALVDSVEICSETKEFLKWITRRLSYREK